MSLINCKEDIVKTNILMEEGDSSLEPGEVKTPPHGSEPMKSTVCEEINTKCSTSQYLPLVKSASKKETDKCAEKVRAILELDAIKRKEELERRKEQKTELSLQSKHKKKGQKKLKGSKEEINLEACVDYTRDKNQEDAKKKLKHKKNFNEEYTNSTLLTTESIESMRSNTSTATMPLLSTMDFVTSTTNVTTNFSRGFPGINSTSFRSYNPFVRNYRTDFRHRGDDFHKHNRTRFPRYRSQYNPGVFNTPSEESSHAAIQSGVPYSQLMWTKTKPSISYAYNIHDRHTYKSSKKCEELNTPKKKKTKKPKESEESNKTQSSPKSRRKSSKRKKIRKIRETLQLQPLKNTLFTNDDLFSADSLLNGNNTTATTVNQNPILDEVASCIQVENENNKSSNMTATSTKPQILDMFACLTPPKQESPPSDVKSSSTNVQITNKLQEMQDRIGKLLDDDELRLEVIQATKEKLLQKSRGHIGIDHPKKLSTKNCQSLNSPINSISVNLSTSEDKPDKTKNPKDTEFVPKSLDKNKMKEKSSFDIFSETKEDVRKNTRGGRDSTPDTLNSKSRNSIFMSVNSLSIKNNRKAIDSLCMLSKSVTCATNGSPDTDDYSDNWENDDDEMDLNSVFTNINQQTPKNVAHISMGSPSSSTVDSAESNSNSKMQSTTPKNSPPPKLCSSSKLSFDPKKIQKPNIVCPERSDMQLLYNQFIKSVENADIETAIKSSEKESNSGSNKEQESEQLSTSSTSYSSSSSSSSDTSVSSSGSTSSTSSSESASDDSNDTDTIQKNDVKNVSKNENATGNVIKRPSSDSEKTTQLTNTKDDSKPNVTKDLKKLENLEANLLRIQMMRANYDSADEISDELLKMEKLFLHEKNIILNKFIDSSMNKSVKIEKESHSDSNTNFEPTSDSIQSASFARGQFVQSLQKLPNKNDVPDASNIFSTNREVIKLTISPVKLPKTSAIFEADNDIENSKQTMDPAEKNNFTVKLPKPAKEVAIVKPIMENKESPSAHHQKRRRSPIISHHTLQSRSRSRRGRVRSLSVSPSRNNSGRCISPQRRSGFSKSSRNRNFERRSRSRSPSFNRQLSRRSGDISPIPRKRRSVLNIDGRFRKQSPRRDSRSHSRSPCSPPHRQRGGRYSRSPLPFKPPSPPTDPNLSPTGSRRNSLSPGRRSRSISRSPNKRITSPSEKSFDSKRHRSLSPKHRPYKQHPPHHSSTSYYFNHSPNRISLDARINIVLNGPSSGNNDNTNSIAAHEDYSHYGQYGPAAYMSLPGDSNSFYTNQYVHMTGPPVHAIQHSYPNLRPVGTDESELFSSIQQHATVNTSNFYYNRFGAQPFGFNQPSPLLKELPKATVAVQKGNVLEIVPCGDLLTSNVADDTHGDNEIRNKKDSPNEQVVDEKFSSNEEKNKRSILKVLDGEKKSLRGAFVSAPKKKQVNFEDGVFPNHNSDDEDRKVIEAKIRVKMRRLKKKHGITPPCQNLFKDKVHTEKQKDSSNKKDQQPPPPPHGFPSTNLEQPIYLRTHTPTPLLYFHFDGVVHSMYVSQMERPIPPRLLNPKCLTSSSIGIVSHHADSQSPLYMQSPITAAAPHLHTSKKDPIATFSRPNRNENISPKVICSTTTLQQIGSPKINFKIYSPIENMHHAENSNVTLPNTSPNSIKTNTIHTISSGSIANHLVPKRQDSPKDAVVTRTNVSMGLLPVPITHPPMSQNIAITSHTRIPVIGVPPTVIPKVISTTAEPYMPGFPPTILQNPHQSINQNYMVSPSIAPSNNPHMTIGVQPYFNTPIHRMHRPLPNYMDQQNQPSPSTSNLPICHLVDPIDSTNPDLNKFTSPQTMAIPFNFKGP